MDSREIDRLVAEKVMGYARRQVRAKGETNTFECFVRPGDESCTDGTWKRHELAAYYSARPYSTDIADAWRVFITVTNQPFSVRKRFFNALQEQTRGDWGTVAWPDVLVCLRDKMPISICLAALQALGVEVPA